jgi:hypothetical protein
MSPCLAPRQLPASTVYHFGLKAARVKYPGNRGRILSLRPFFLTCQVFVSAIGTSRNLGNDGEWKVNLLF